MLTLVKGKEQTTEIATLAEHIRGILDNWWTSCITTWTPYKWRKQSWGRLVR